MKQILFRMVDRSSDSLEKLLAKNLNVQNLFRALAKRTHKSTQVCKTRTCVQTCNGWLNGCASWCASSCKLQKVVNFRHKIIQLVCNQLVYKFYLHQCQHQSMQVNASGWPNETQVECKSKTYIDLRIC